MVRSVVVAVAVPGLSIPSVKQVIGCNATETHVERKQQALPIALHKTTLPALTLGSCPSYFIDLLASLGSLLFARTGHTFCLDSIGRGLV